jgi:adenosylmethionine-8-amino-7-oxononanoate aminotransferase
VARISNTARFRVGDGDDDAALCARLLDELERTIQNEGPDQIALIIAEPVQNAGGCLEPPAGYWEGLRTLADRYGILLCADEVITGFGRLGEWFAASRYGARPDLLTVAKGLTSAHAAMGAVLVSDRVAEPLYEPGRMLVHGITFAGHPVSAAIALRNLEIFERDGVLENVRALEGHLRSRMQELTSLPIVADVRGAGFFWAAELVKDERNTRFDADERERLVRGLLPRELVEAGLIARADDRGEPVLQIAPPLICDAAQLDEIVDAMAAVLTVAGKEMAPAAASR